MEVLLRFRFSWSSLVYLLISWRATWLEFTRHGGVGSGVVIGEVLVSMHITTSSRPFFFFSIILPTILVPASMVVSPYRLFEYRIYSHISRM